MTDTVTRAQIAHFLGRGHTHSRLMTALTSCLHEVTGSLSKARVIVATLLLLIFNVVLRVN